MLGFYYIVSGFYFPEYMLGFSFLTMPILVYRSIKHKLVVTYYLGYSCYLVTMFQVIISFLVFNMFSSDLMNLSVGELFYHKAVLHLLSIGLLVYVVKTIITFFNISDKLYKRSVSFSEEFLSVWGMYVYLVMCLTFIPDLAYGFMLIPMFVLFYRAHLKELKFTCILGFISYLMIFIQIANSIEQVNSFSLSAQTFYGKIAILKAFFTLWIMQFFFEKTMPENLLLPFFKKVRVFFYMLVPICFLSTIYRNFYSYFGFALWGSVFTAFFMNQYLKIRLLLIETHLLVLTAVMYGIGITLLFENVSLLDPSYLQFSAGLFFYGICLYSRNGFREKSYNDEHYKYIFISAFIFPGLALASGAYNLIGSESIFINVLGIYLVAMFLLRNKIYMINHFQEAYLRTAQGFICFAFFTDFLELLYSNTYSLAVYTPVQAIALLTLFFATHFDRERYKTQPTFRFNLFKRLQNFDLYVFHFIAAGFYLIAILGVSGSLEGPLVTIAISLHAVIVLFYSFKNREAKLLPFYTTAFCLAAVKIILYDIKDFSIFEKIIVFTVIGLVFLSAAFFLQKSIVKEKHKS